MEKSGTSRNRKTAIEEARTENGRADAQNYRAIARRYQDERDQARARALAFEGELSHSKDQIKDLNDTITTLKADVVNPMRERTVETVVTAATDYATINWKSR
jgi:hypothetical protein